MKKILAGVAFAGLMAAPVMADTPASERPPPRRLIGGHARQSGADERTFQLPTQGQSTPDPDPAKTWPNDTAPDFWPAITAIPTEAGMTAVLRLRMAL
jgi:hypothetical protein